MDIQEQANDVFAPNVTEISGTQLSTWILEAQCGNQESCRALIEASRSVTGNNGLPFQGDHIKALIHPASSQVLINLSNRLDLPQLARLFGPYIEPMLRDILEARGPHYLSLHTTLNTLARRIPGVFLKHCPGTCYHLIDFMVEESKKHANMLASRSMASVLHTLYINLSMYRQDDAAMLHHHPRDLAARLSETRG